MQNETFESIINWGDDTFGPCNIYRAIYRAREEFEELDDELFLLALEQTTDKEVAYEAADVIICLLRVPGVVDSINEKMAINRQRKWHKNGDGTGYHIKVSDQERTPTGDR